MTYYYCDGWFRAEKKLTEEWTVDQAKRAHENRSDYTVLINSKTKPSGFVEIRDTFIAVGLLDSLLRVRLTVVFNEIEPDRVFLTQMTDRHFGGDSDKVSWGDTYYFQPDGSLRILREEFAPKSRTITETSTDVTANYDRYPEFGDYAHLLREDRQPLRGK